MVTCQVNGVSVRHGTARTEETLAAVPADDGAHLSQHILLHQGEHRGHLIGIDGRIERIGQPLTQQPVRVQAGEQLVHKVRVARLHAVFDDVARQFQQLLVADTLGWQREVDPGAQIARIHPFDHAILPGGRLHDKKCIKQFLGTITFCSSN